MKTLLIKLSGPLQSWGTSSHFETRQTDRYPSKSAIIGLIAASYGFRRTDTKEINELNKLNFAIRVDQEGGTLRDYQTVKKYKKNGTVERTYVTNRYYLEDAIFVVGISHEDDTWIDDILYHLRNPYFQTFMGRRALPLPVDFLIDISEQNLLKKLESLPWQAKSWYQKLHANEIPIYADADLLNQPALNVRQDKVVSFSQKKRNFKPRGEARKIVKVQRSINYQDQKFEEHDAFNGIGG